MVNILDREPGLVAVAGDWHGNLRWALRSVYRISPLLAGEENKLVLHAGDFGVWPGRTGEAYLDELDRALGAQGMTVAFVDGNHEDHPQLAGYRGDDTGYPPVPVMVRESIWWLPRGARWEWHGKKWLAMGGAASPNRANLRPGVSWWPGEYITGEQVDSAIKAGPADVILSHEAPSGVFIAYDLYNPVALGWAQEDLDRGDEQRALLQRLGDGVRPSRWVHGHHHKAYQKRVWMPGDLAWRTGAAVAGGGPGVWECEVTGLGKDGDRLNWLLLDTRDMSFAVPEEEPS